MLVKVGNEFVHELFAVLAREKSRERLGAIDGTSVRCRYGWQLTDEDGGIYAGEAAMVVMDRAIAVSWIPSGDLQRIDETGARADQLALESAA